MLVRTDDGAIDKMDRPVQRPVGRRLLLQVGKDPVPDALLPPALEAAGYGPPRAVSTGQVFPWRARPQDP